MSKQYTWSEVTSDNDVQKYHCPYCDAEVVGNIYDDIQEEIPCSSGVKYKNGYYILQCPCCDLPAIYNCETKQVIPNCRGFKNVKHLPENIEKVYNEVRDGIAAGCYTSAVMLARTALMHIAIEQGAEDNKSFQFYVKYLDENGYIPRNGKAWVDKIRLMGNGAVHRLEIWEKEDAELIAKFLMYLLIFIYELPNSIE